MHTTRFVLSCLLSIVPLLPATVMAQQKPPQKQPPQPQQPTQPPSAYDQALARYRECLSRLPFRYHTDGRERLASTRRPEALQLLIEDYLKPKAHPEYTRYILGTLFSRNFDNAASVPALDALWKANGKPVDMWMWVQVLRIHADRAGDQELLDIITTSKNAMHRAAAIAALGESKNGNLKQALVSTCVDFPKKEPERNILIGAMSGAIHANRRRVNDQEFRDGLKAYIGLLDPEVGLSHTIKVQMARHLMWTLNGPSLFVDPQSWLELLERGDIKKPAPTTTVAAPRFFGIETDGERFCYVVDMSDSMCKEISPSAKPSAPLTGPKQKKPKGVLPDESDIPWHKVKTRWDLAREQLKISLQRLSNDKHFAIVWFGDGSGTFESTKGMVKATKANIDRAIAELDSIETGKIDPVKAPDGQLRGKTNLHSGLRRAFGLTDKGFVDTLAYVDGNALTEGCDTVFLLSDGAPSWDDFEVVDKDYGEDKVVVDTEYGAAAPRTPQVHYHGPYVHDEWLIEDFRRMNAFRRIRMHCIGLGEANMGLLNRLAEIGHGETYAVGSKAAAARKTGK